MSLGETENSATTILGNNIKATDGVNGTVQVSASANDGSVWVALNYSNGITFNRIAAAAIGTQYSENAGELMRITTAGNVGIGTASPSAKLHVEDGNIFIGNFSAHPSPNGSSSTSSGHVLRFDNTYNGRKIILHDNGFAPDWFGGFGVSLSDMDYFSGANHRFYVGSTAGADGTEAFTIRSSGNVGIGTASPSGRLHVTDATDRTEITSQFQITGAGYTGYHFLDATAYYIGQNSNSRELRVYSGSSTAVGVRLTAGNNAWTTYSDERLKDIIEPIENAIEKVSTLRTVIGKYKTDDINKRRVFMFAQDVNAVLPEAVTEDSDGMLGMAFDHIVPLLTAAIKEQQALISNLTARLAALESK
jgi:hypothetical protein